MRMIEQWLSGRDFARGDASAAGMVNFVYLLADPVTRSALLVDPAWNVDALLSLVRERDLEPAGALLTHWHPDHAGGDLWGLQVEGAAHFREQTGALVHAHREEVPWLARTSGLEAEAITPHDDDDELAIGRLRVRFVHTPGHSPGSTCFLVRDDEAAADAPAALCTGDTLFVGSCGRVDLPGSDPGIMHDTLTRRLGALPGETVVLPGHDYGPTPTSTLAAEQRTNPALAFPDLESWLARMA